MVAREDQNYEASKKDEYLLFDKSKCSNFRKEDKLVGSCSS
jgi:hypothetical protein